MTKSTYNHFLFQPLPKLLSPPNILFDYIIKVIIAYHLYYKNKFIGNLTWSFVYIINFFHFLCNLGNLLIVSLLIYNNNAYITKLSSVTKKKELQRTLLYLISCLFQLFFLNSTLSKCIIMSK